MSTSNEELRLDKLKEEIKALLWQKEMKLIEEILEKSTNIDFRALYDGYEKEISESVVLLKSQTQTLSLEQTIEICERIKDELGKQLRVFVWMDDEFAHKKLEETKTQLEYEKTDYPIIKALKSAVSDLGWMAAPFKAVGLGLIGRPFQAFGSWAGKILKPIGKSIGEWFKNILPMDKNKKQEEPAEAQNLDLSLNRESVSEKLETLTIEGFENLFPTDKNKKQEEPAEAQNLDLPLNREPALERLGSLTAELNSRESTSHTSTTNHRKVVIHTSLDPSSPLDATQAGPPAHNTEVTRPKNDSNSTP